MSLMYLATLALGVIIATGLVWGFVSLLQQITDKKELKKFILLGIIFFFIIAAYWMVRPLKDSFFSVIVGRGHRGAAKIASVILISSLVILYSKLLDIFRKEKVIYILTTVYGCALLVFMLLFMHPTIGLANLAASPTRIIGWAWYIFVESIGSLVVACFWAFTTDITMPEEAKRGFPILILFAQLGNIGGPLSNILLLQLTGSGAPFVGLAGILLFFAGAMVWLFLRIIPKNHLVGYHDTDEKMEPGLFDGLKLLINHTYLLCIFGIVTMFEILQTLLDLYLKDEVASIFPKEFDQTLFLDKFAFVVGIIATLALIFRIGKLPRILGLLPSLILLPVIVIIGFIAINISSSLGYLLYGLFGVVATFKAVNFALNQQTVKQLYIPTTPSAKYKSQAWIDTFGTRSAKASGGIVDTIKRFIAPYQQLPAYLVIAIVLAGFIWIPAAIFAARRYNKAIKDNEVIC